MRYHQITHEERYTLAALRAQQPRLSRAEIARRMRRHPSTIGRELRRNCSRSDGGYRADQAQQRRNGRHETNRGWTKLTAAQWMIVEELLWDRLSPDQISGRLRSAGLLQVSHETIYRYVWNDKRAGGQLHLCLRQHTRRRRKRYATKERRGRVANKRHITTRPASANHRSCFGHWEIDTVHGSDQHAIVTLVERRTGLLLIGKLQNLSAATLNKRVLWLIRRFERTRPGSFLTITADNGSEFHRYKRIERCTGVRFYFATPYHSWERGTSENTNGLIRQYLPKRVSFASLSQRQCDTIASHLNHRPRKRHAYATPLEVLWSHGTASRRRQDDLPGLTLPRPSPFIPPISQR